MKERKKQKKPMTGGEVESAKKEPTRHLEKEAFQLANYYFVFQGIIFTAFYHASSHVKCDHRWVPMTLSALDGILNACALLRIALRYKTSLDDADTGAGHDNMCQRSWRCFYVIVCMTFVIVFLVVTLAGCWVVSCSTDTLSPDTD
ncbi:hypothetical protein AAHA92_32458 [Salvia divinorum]|uniref:Transmembrane protein n=1 Tax=Salvia divinorum TaxID=28513 RepID=A0ABD1FKW7_SALDI